MAVQMIHRSGGRRYGPTALNADGGVGTKLEDHGPNRVDRPGGSPLARHAPPAGGAPSLPGTASVSPRLVRPLTRPAGAPLGYVGRVPMADCPTGSSSPGYRMGRWTRLSMTIVVTAAVIVAAVTVLVHPAAPATAFVTVQPGDTLVSIAHQVAPRLATSDAVTLLESLNGLDAPSVEVGMVLRVPAG